MAFGDGEHIINNKLPSEITVSDTTMSSVSGGRTSDLSANREPSKIGISPPRKKTKGLLKDHGIGTPLRDSICGRRSRQLEDYFINQGQMDDGRFLVRWLLEGHYKIDVPVDDVLKIIDVELSREGEILLLSWKSGETKYMRSSILTRLLGRCPMVLHHYEPRYSHTRVLARYDKIQQSILLTTC